MASKCTKCGNIENYNFALNIGLCDPCIGERIEELEVALSIIKYHTKNALHYYKANKPKEMMGAFEQALNS